MVAVMCTWIALVVCETDETPPKEATPENKEIPAEKDETTADKGETTAEKTTYKDCFSACKKNRKACLESCIDSFLLPCNPKCLIAEQLCKVLCVMS